MRAIRREERGLPTAARVERRSNGEVWRVTGDLKPASRRRFLGFVDHMDAPHPPHWPTAGWWAGAGRHCHVTGLETEAEAMTTLLDALGVDPAEWVNR